MAFDLELECAKARERIHRSIGQRWRHAKAETKRLADAARAEIGLPTHERKSASFKARNDMLDALQVRPTYIGLWVGPDPNEICVSGDQYVRAPALQWPRRFDAANAK